MFKKNKRCPCQSSFKYRNCCFKYHEGTKKSPTAEALSRARHSAIIFNKPTFIYDTWDEATRPSKQDIKQLLTGKIKDAGYKIIHTDMGLEKHDIGMITSMTQYNQKELESYKRIDNEWKFFKSEKIK